MLAMGAFQTGSNLGWIWVVLVLLLLALVIWWLTNRRSSEMNEVKPVETRSAPPAPVTTEKPVDDLQKIEGIGPKVAKVLNGAGITTFEALAHANPADVQQKLKAAGLQMMNPQGWIEQADLAAKGDWEGFKKLQDELQGGRRK